MSPCHSPALPAAFVCAAAGALSKVRLPTGSGNVSQNQFWFSKLHTLKGSQEQLYSSYHLKCHLTKAFFVTNLANLSSISSCISSYSTSSPGPASAGLVAIAFAASSRSLLTRNQGFDSFCCQDALYFLPTFFFVLLVGLNGFRSC